MTVELPAGTRTPSRLRRATIKVVERSALVPQFAVERPVAAAPLLALRAKRKDEGLDGSVSDMLAAACAHALREHPEVNGTFHDGHIVVHPQINLAHAVATDDGLTVPCLHDADLRSLADLARLRADLDARARAGRLRPEELFDTTFTISNLGPLGVRRFQALVLPPQAAILAVGAPYDGEISLVLTVDHRVLDGAPAARFLGSVADRVSEPAWMEALVTSADVAGAEA
jgi:pyruvate dehydrogenase E2 component (dihydrolipoamide acetyltransferase)